jgi:branched-chain amino acid transport system permease protein
VYVVAALGCGLAGALYFVSNLRISPDAAFGVNWTAFAIFIIMIGGIGRIEGALAGALVFWALNKFLSDYGTWYQLGLGLLAVLMTLGLRQGLAGFIEEKLRFELLPIQRRLKL